MQAKSLCLVSVLVAPVYKVTIATFTPEISRSTLFLFFYLFSFLFCFVFLTQFDPLTIGVWSLSRWPTPARFDHCCQAPLCADVVTLRLRRWSTTQFLEVNHGDQHESDSCRPPVFFVVGHFWLFNRCAQRWRRQGQTAPLPPAHFFLWPVLCLSRKRKCHFVQWTVLKRRWNAIKRLCWSTWHFLVWLAGGVLTNTT